jgi:hypothetical protein
MLSIPLTFWGQQNQGDTTAIDNNLLLQLNSIRPGETRA